MQNRREFLRQSLGLGAGLLAPSLLQAQPQQQVQQNINAQLQGFQKRLCAIGIESELRMVNQPTQGLVHWEWGHFHPMMKWEDIPHVERTNKEILDGLRMLSKVPGSGLDAIFLEGVVAGKEKETVADGIDFHRTLVRSQLTYSVPFTGQIVFPKEKEIDDQVKSLKDADKRITQYAQSKMFNGRREMEMTILGRIGGGFAFAQESGAKIMATEDPKLDARAEWAERYGPRDPYYHEHVVLARNRHYVEVAVKSNRRMVHQVLGCGHSLVEEVDRSNNGIEKGISLLVVRVDGVKPIKKKVEEDRAGLNFPKMLKP